MNKDRIKDLIRKLLQAGQGQTVEAERARQRAHALMERHGIEMRLVTDREMSVRGVVGSYWRSMLLDTIARLKGCRVVEREQFAVVVGDYDSVPRVIERYRLVNVQIAAKAAKRWAQSSSRWKAFGLIEPLLSREQERVVGPILFRLLVVSIAETFAQSAIKDAKPEVVYEPLPAGTKRSEPLATLREGDVIIGELEELAAIFGRNEAATLVEYTVSSGVIIGEKFANELRESVLRLPADSAAFEALVPAGICTCGCPSQQHKVIEVDGWWVTAGKCRTHYTGGLYCTCPRYLRYEAPTAPPRAATPSDYATLGDLVSQMVRTEWLEAVTGKNRCICVGNSNWCSHIGPCREDRSRGVSDAYCEKCLANAKAESQ